MPNEELQSSEEALAAILTKHRETFEEQVASLRDMLNSTAVNAPPKEITLTSLGVSLDEPIKTLFNAYPELQTLLLLAQILRNQSKVKEPTE